LHKFIPYKCEWRAPLLAGHWETLQKQQGFTATPPQILRPANVEKMRKALEKAGIEFTNGDALGVRLKKKPR
jgi:hypothetical protein